MPTRASGAGEIVIVGILQADHAAPTADRAVLRVVAWCSKGSTVIFVWLFIGRRLHGKEGKSVSAAYSMSISVRSFNNAASCGLCA
jgi:hypothetical protein